MRKLETLLADIDYGALPPEWTTFDLETFSRAKTLWDYQQDALRNAIKALWRYHGDAAAGDTRDRKRRFLHWYQDNGIGFDDVAAGKPALATEASMLRELVRPISLLMASVNCH